MITDFLDSPERNDHDAFQLWRREHSDSYFFAFQTKNTAKLHINGGCRHPGDAEWTTSDGASLTRKRKVCAEALAELNAWADDNGVAWTWCADCNRGRGERVASSSSPPSAPSPKPPIAATAARLVGLRQTPGYAAAVFEHLCGAANILPCAEWLADAIEQAAESGGAWAITLTRENILLNVGPVRLLAISPQSFWFATTDDEGDVPGGVEEHAEGRDAILYKSVPVPTRDFTAPPAMVGELPARMRAAFLSYVAEAAARRRGVSLSIRAHSPGVVTYLNDLLGRSLPSPEGAPTAAISDGEGEDISADKDYVEGRRRTLVLDVHERDRNARAACIRAHGVTCAACGMSFGERYGELGEGFIEVHHLNPMADAAGERKVDPVRDLVPVCPNCHRMLHREDPPLTPAQLADRLRR